MNPVYHSAFLESLGWSLVDSLWQMGSVWLLYVLITGNGKQFSAHKRYGIALIALFSGSLWFMASFFYHYHHALEGQTGTSLAFQLAGTALELSYSAKLFEQLLPLVSSVYLLILVFLSIRFLIRYRSVEIGMHRGLSPAGEALDTFLRRLTEVSGVKKNVALWLSANIQAPLTAGFFKPVILLPVAMVNQLSMEQAEAVIAHEFFHIRRGDYILNFCVAVIDVVMFFNPFVKTFVHIIGKERENSCDDQVIALGYDRWDYAHALYLLGKNTHTPYSLTLQATGGNSRVLLERVQRLMKRRIASASLVKPLSTFFLCLLLTTLASRNAELDQGPEISGKPAVVSAIVEVSNRNVNQQWSSEPLPGSLASKEAAPKKPAKKVIASQKAAPAIPEAPENVSQEIEELPAVPEPPNPPSEEPVRFSTVTHYISETEAIEFAIIDTEYPVTQPAVSGRIYPYVPKSSFYYPSAADTLSECPGEIIHL